MNYSTFFSVRPLVESWKSASNAGNFLCWLLMYNKWKQSVNIWSLSPSTTPQLCLCLTVCTVCFMFPLLPVSHLFPNRKRGRESRSVYLNLSKCQPPSQKKSRPDCKVQSLKKQRRGQPKSATCKQRHVCAYVVWRLTNLCVCVYDNHVRCKQPQIKAESALKHHSQHFY